MGGVTTLLKEARGLLPWEYSSHKPPSTALTLDHVGKARLLLGWGCSEHFPSRCDKKKHLGKATWRTKNLFCLFM